MSDRTSAEIFGKMFNLLAVNPTIDHRLLAMELWKKRVQYDFHPTDMYADEACIKLGLAIPCISPEKLEVIFID